MTDNLASLEARVYGRVQGVFFRAFVARRAIEMGITGYARNLTDGSVEVRAEGGRAELNKLVDYLGVGPPAARVDKVTTQWTEATGRYTGFSTG